VQLVVTKDKSFSENHFFNNMFNLKNAAIHLLLYEFAECTSMAKPIMRKDNSFSFM